MIHLNKKYSKFIIRHLKTKSVLNIKKEYYKASQGKVDLKKATSKELKIIRDKVIANRRTENRIQFTVLCFLILIISFVGFNFFESENNKVKAYNIGRDRIERAEKIDVYMFFIADGDKWIQKKHWDNAIFQYKEALSVFPNEYDAHYRLSLAYSYLCQNKNIKCEEGKRIISKLKKQFPTKNEILEIEAIFDEYMVQ